jgi:hypothetical protein
VRVEIALSGPNADTEITVRSRSLLKKGLQRDTCRILRSSF